MKELRGRDLLWVGFTLFSMFFGAGNLIFPPFLGAQAGTLTWLAMPGFALSAIGLPVLGVVAVAKSGGLQALGARVHPYFAAVFTLLIYLSIGPCLAIPRTASTSFEMAVTPFTQTGSTLRLAYSVLFFAVAAALALRPEKLTDRLGKVLCPALITLIVILFVGCIAHPVASGYGTVADTYRSLPTVRGFLDGYQTMDAIAALNFGAIIALNVRARGITDDRAVVRGTIHAGFIAGAIFLIIYSMLAHIGALSGAAFPGGETGADTLTRLVAALFGRYGNVLLAAIFVIACLNTCIGLLSCCSDYFHNLVPRVSYRMWVVFFAAISVVIANLGLAAILKVTLPVLNAIYPPAIMLIVLALGGKALYARRAVYPLTIGCTSVVSVVSALAGAGLSIPFLANAFARIPLASLGLGWVIPALCGLVIGMIVSPRYAA